MVDVVDHMMWLRLISSTSKSEYFSSRRISSVCSPSLGAALRMRPGRGRQLGHHARHPERLAVAGDHALDHAARLEVRVGGDVGHAVDAARRHFRFFHFLQHLFL